GTPAGKLLRNYWQPVALTEELKGPRPVKAVRLLGEDLVLFKEKDRYGLLARHCAHRGADLAYGRLEDGGLRCSFHGWLYDVGGTPADSQMPISKLLREHDRPEIRVERTDYGMRLQTLRKINDAHTHIRVTNILFPQAFVIPMNAEMTISQWHVPVDDTGCYWYSIFTSFGGPVDKKAMRSQRLKTYPAPDYRPIH